MLWLLVLSRGEHTSPLQTGDPLPTGTYDQGHWQVLRNQSMAPTVFVYLRSDTCKGFPKVHGHKGGTCLCRTAEKAAELAAALGSGARAATLEAVSSREVTGDVLMNSTSVGMHAMEGQSPVNREGLQGYRLVFDAIYTPLRTRLIQVHNRRPS